MPPLSSRHHKILGALLERGDAPSSAIHSALLERGENLSLVTVKRALAEMMKRGVLTASGAGRSIRYSVSPLGRIFAHVDADAYCAIEPDRRYGLRRYNFDLLPALPPNLFTDEERTTLDNATAEYKRRVKDLPPAIQKKELERLIIELSWKSSKIEGNTYTLLDTEKLIRDNKAATGKTPEETRMILNHKDAFQFIHRNTARFRTMTRRNLEELHALLVKDLSVGRGLRKKPVGVIGSRYQPLDNVHQISDAVDILITAVSRMSTPYGKSLAVLVGISYIQPFEDGNKRTGRLMANALLLAHGCASLSYRSVDENEYRAAMLAFYELNALTPMKKIFIAQYDFAARNYAVR